MSKEEAIVSSKQIDSVILESHLEDPVFKDIELVLKEDKLDFSHVYRIKKYLDNPEMRSATSFDPKAINWLFQNLRFIHKIVKNDNARRIYLSLQYPYNTLQLSLKLKINRASVRHWVDKLLEMELVSLHEWSQGMEKLWRRNSDNRPFEVNLLEHFCLKEHKERALNKVKDELSY